MTDEELSQTFNVDKLREIAEPRSEEAIQKAEERKCKQSVINNFIDYHDVSFGNPQVVLDFMLTVYELFHSIECNISGNDFTIDYNGIVKDFYEKFWKTKMNYYYHHDKMLSEIMDILYNNDETK